MEARNRGAARPELGIGIQVLLAEWQPWVPAFPPPWFEGAASKTSRSHLPGASGMAGDAPMADKELPIMVEHVKL